MAAAKTIADVANNGSSRRVLLGWLNAFDRQGSAEGEAVESTSTTELSPEVPWPAYETYASQVLPRELTLCSDDTQSISPIAELSALRITSTVFHATNPSSTRCLSAVRGRQLELDAVLTAPEGASMSSLTVMGAPSVYIRIVVACRRDGGLGEARRAGRYGRGEGGDGNCLMAQRLNPNEHAHEAQDGRAMPRGRQCRCG
jgi:hypothetical protein